MEFYKRFYELLDSVGKEWGGRRRLANQAGITEDSLNKIISRKTKDPGLASVAALVDAIGIEAFISDDHGQCSDIRRELSYAKSRISDLEAELSSLRGQLIGMERAHSAALEKLSSQNSDKSPNGLHEKSYTLQESSIGENVG